MTEQEKREKVIRSLETAVKNFERYSGDEYGREYDYARVEVETLEDAIALLKAQEPVEPRASRGWYKCGACGNGIATILDNGEPSHKERYCNLCGRAVKWE